MLATDCSERDSLAEPLPWIQALLLGGVDYPLLVLQIGDFTPYSFEPHSRLSGVADAPPELTDQIGQDGALFPWHTVIGFQRFFEHPRCVATEVPLGFDIALINAAPGCAQQEIGNVPRIRDRKSTRLNSSHVEISYAVFCLKKKKKENIK